MIDRKILGMEEKIYITAQQLLNDSFELGIRIFKSGFRPSFIVGVWRGGTPVGIAVQEILDELFQATICRGVGEIPRFYEQVFNGKLFLQYQVAKEALEVYFGDFLAEGLGFLNVLLPQGEAKAATTQEK